MSQAQAVINIEVTYDILRATLNHRLRQYIEFMVPRERELFLVIAENMTKEWYPAPMHMEQHSSQQVINSFSAMRELAAIYATTRYPTFHSIDKLYFDQYGEVINEHQMLVTRTIEASFTRSFYAACHRTVEVDILPSRAAASDTPEVTAYVERTELVNARLLSLAKAIRQADIVLPTIAETIA